MAVSALSSALDPSSPTTHTQQQVLDWLLVSVPTDQLPARFTKGSHVTQSVTRYSHNNENSNRQEWEGLMGGVVASAGDVHDETARQQVRTHTHTHTHAHTHTHTHTQVLILKLVSYADTLCLCGFFVPACVLNEGIGFGEVCVCVCVHVGEPSLVSHTVRLHSLTV